MLTVYYLEFFQGAVPCELCIYQRVPYFIVIFLAVTSLIIKKINYRKIILASYILVFTSSLVLSAYHFGIEKNLWNSFIGCEVDFENFSNTNDLKNYLLNKEYIPCSEVSFSFLGLSLAGYNIIVSSLLLLISLFSFKKI